MTHSHGTGIQLVAASSIAVLLALGDGGCSKSKNQAAAKKAAKRISAMQQEAQANLTKLTEAAKAYWETEHSTPQGTLLPRQFPPSEQWTPKTPCCKNEHGTCSGTVWMRDGNSWRKLLFETDRTHLLQYQILSCGIGDKARFLARAAGDPLCDGHWVVFEREVTIADGKTKVSPMRQYRTTTLPSKGPDCGTGAAK